MGPSTEKPKAESSSGNEAQYLAYCSLSLEEIRQLAASHERSKAMIPISKVSKEDFLRVEPMTFWEELMCILFLGFGVPNGAFTIPISVYLFGRFVVGSVSTTVMVLSVRVFIPLTIMPQPFVPATLHSKLAYLIVKYFSFRFILESPVPPKPEPGGDFSNYRPRILVAPPHGVFPYGNILSMVAYPVICGHAMRGLASSAALRPPIFKQIMRSIGVIDASRSVARKALENHESLGISTGGVAEVFETNADDECIVIRNRVGLIKLAIRTGADLVPCYLFGNTKLMSSWAGEGIPYARPTIEYISRKIGFALILIFGRFGLPLPRRLPIVAVMGKPISTHQIKCQEPTAEQVKEIQEQLISEMDGLFERYKGMYGWDEKKLIIK